MGAGPSKLVDKTTRDELLRSTQPTRYLMDRILDYLLREIKPKDFAQLSSETECSKYVIFLANMFNSIFVPLRVAPSKDSRGVIMFRKVEDLRDASKIPHRRALCVALGYFYTKLFQILAALSYSIFDESHMRIYDGYMLGGPAASGQVLLPPGAGFRGGRDRGVVQKGTTPLSLEAGLDVSEYTIRQHLRGGALTDIPRNFQTFLILHKFLNTTEKEGRYQFSNQTHPGYVFQLDVLDGYGTVYLYDKRYNKLLLTVDITIVRKPRIIIDDKEASTYQITYDRVKEYDDRAGYTKHDINLSELVYITPTDKSYRAVEYPRKRVDNLIMDNIFDVYKNITRGDGVLPARKAAVGEREQRRIIRRRLGEGEKKYVPAAAAAAQMQDAAISSLLSVSTRPVAHCVARALQLLDIDALGPTLPKETRSYICLSKFNEQIAASAPPRGSTFSKHAGIQALSTLFTVFQGSAPQLLTPAKQQYLSFLQKFGAAMNSPTKPVDRGISDMSKYQGQLTDGRTAQFCKNKSQDIPLRVSGNSLSVARSGAQELFRRQYLHAVEVNKLLRQLFEITPQGQIKIHTQVMQGGIPALDLVAAKARQLLMQYYEGCELTYQNTINALSGTGI